MTKTRSIRLATLPLLALLAGSTTACVAGDDGNGPDSPIDDPTGGTADDAEAAASAAIAAEDADVEVDFTPTEPVIESYHLNAHDGIYWLGFPTSFDYFPANWHDWYVLPAAALKLPAWFIDEVFFDTFRSSAVEEWHIDRRGTSAPARLTIDGLIQGLAFLRNRGKASFQLCHVAASGDVDRCEDLGSIKRGHRIAGADRHHRGFARTYVRDLDADARYVVRLKYKLECAVAYVSGYDNVGELTCSAAPEIGVRFQID